MSKVPMRILLLLALTALGLGLGACSEDDRNDAEKTVDSVRDEAEDEVGEAGARAAGEAYRAALKADDGGDADGLRSIAVLEENSQDLPGDPEVAGIDDGDGDGQDDDGKVELKVSDKSACVTVPETGEDVDVTDGAC